MVERPSEGEISVVAVGRPGGWGNQNPTVAATAAAATVRRAFLPVRSSEDPSESVDGVLRSGIEGEKREKSSTTKEKREKRVAIETKPPLAWRNKRDVEKRERDEV